MKIWAAVLVGFLLGAFLQPIPSIKAQVYPHEMGVHVRYMAGTLGADGKIHTDAMIPGSQVVGFVCLPAEKNVPQCYFASKD